MTSSFSLDDIAAHPQYNVTVNTEDPSGLAILLIAMMYKRPIQMGMGDVYGVVVYRVRLYNLIPIICI
jgi:hypothetical protein